MDNFAGLGARFAETDEIMNCMIEVNMKENEAVTGGIPVISDGQQMYVAGEDSNSLIVADPGSGKSRRIAAPMIYSLALAGHSMVIHDCKGELYKWTSLFLKEHGYKIKVLNFRAPTTGDQWNPLSYGASLYKEGRMDEAAEVFSQLALSLYERVHSEKDMFWEVQAGNYLTALCLLACKETVTAEEVNLRLIYKIFCEGNERGGGTTYLKNYLSLEEDTVLKQAFAGIAYAPSETKGSIDAVFSSVLNTIVTNMDINDMLSGNTIEPRELVEEKTAIFIISKDESAVYNPLISVFMDQMYVRLIGEAEKIGGKLARTIDFVLDEFCNFTKINDFNTKISACRSRNIRMHLFVQSLNQLEITYGKMAYTIMGCCQNWILMHSPEIKMLELFSKRCGEYVSEYLHQRVPLVSMFQLQHLSKEKGETLMLLGRYYPFISRLPDKDVYVKKNDIQELDNIKLPVRERIKESPFSIKQNVEEKREKRCKELLEQNPEQKGELADMLGRINEQIRELEKEGKKSQEIENTKKNIGEKTTEEEEVS